MIDLDRLNLTEDAALYYNVEGVPVTIGHADHPGCRAWDEIPPRPFRVSSLQRNGWQVSVEDFRRLVAEALGGDP